MRKATTQDANETDEPRRTYNLLVFGIERQSLTPPKELVKRSNYSLTFEPYNTSRRFHEFDGVILFQGIFEQIHYLGGMYNDSYVEVECDREQMDRRFKELQLLLQQGGLVCFILCKSFTDRAKYGPAKNSDLTKITLNIDSFYRENLSNRIPSLNTKRNEFIRFLQLYGAASSYFTCLNKNLELQPIATVGSYLASFIIFGNMYYVPSLIPQKEKVEEYFDLLAEAITSTANKLKTEVPSWIDVFKFSEEKTLLERKRVIEDEARQLEERIENFQRFKHILVANDDPLVSAVAEVLQGGFGFFVDDTDEYREDLKIVDENKQPLVFIEVKGTNAGVKREHVNQADNHRERAGLSPNFPAVLIINTHIKNARKLEEKDKPVPNDQVEHAEKNSVIILRTLDLLALLELLKKGSMSSTQVLELFSGRGGWLRVWGLETPELMCSKNPLVSQ